MVSHTPLRTSSRSQQSLAQLWGWWLYILLVVLLLAGCTPGGDQGQPSAPSAPSLAVERQALANLLALYQEAVVAEDSDRLQALLAPAGTLAQAQRGATSPAPRQEPTGAFADLAAFQAAMSATFRQHTVTALAIPPETVESAPDQSRVTFLEVESTLDSQTLAQHTRVYRTTWELSRVGTDVVRLGISAVSRQGPLVEVTTPGLLVAGPPQPLTVRATSEDFVLAAVEVPEPRSGAVQRLAMAGAQGQGTFTAPAGAALHALPVRALSATGETLVFAHRYRLHHVREGLAQRVVGTGTTRFLAVTVAPDGTVWAGGDGGGRLYQVRPGDAPRRSSGGRAPGRPRGAGGRPGRGPARPPARRWSLRRRRSGGDRRWRTACSCQTVNVLDPTYPLRDLARDGRAPVRGWCRRRTGPSGWRAPMAG